MPARYFLAHEVAESVWMKAASALLEAQRARPDAWVHFDPTGPAIVVSWSDGGLYAGLSRFLEASP